MFLKYEFQIFILCSKIQIQEYYTKHYTYARAHSSHFLYLRLS